jgi:hypothetical protein
MDNHSQDLMVKFGVLKPILILILRMQGSDNGTLRSGVLRLGMCESSSVPEFKKKKPKLICFHPQVNTW